MIDILLATYNSEKYITALLDSILTQSYQDIKIIVSDDGSNDKTIPIIKAYINRYPDKLILLPFIKNHGVKDNFNYLLQHSTNDYIAFADHDDIWSTDKLLLSIEKIQSIEDNQPALVFTDKAIVDQDLNIITLSADKYEHLGSNNFRLNKLLVQNAASGCTIMINKRLKDLIKTIPEEAIMHDHYLLLTAILFGKVSYIDKPLILYRQHSSNEIGAKKYGFRYIIEKIFTQRNALRKRFISNITQSQKITELFYDSIKPEDLYILEKFNLLDKVNFFQFRYIVIKYKFFKTGLIRNLGLLIKF